MTSVVVGVVVRVLINVLCSQNEKLAASALGLWDGFAVYQAHLDNSLLDVGTLLQITLGFLFDFLFFGSIVRTVAYCAWLLLGILASDFGPDLWYDFGGEDITKDFRRELNTLLSYISLEGDNGSSRRRNRSRSRSPATSVGRKSEGETTVRGLASTSGTSRRRRSTRRPDDQSTVLTRDSRVTFDETSIAQSQTEESSIEDGGDTELQSSTDVQGLYMEPSTAASHLGVRSAAQSLLRRMYDDDGDTDTTHTQTRRRSHSSISRSGGGDTTPRGNQFGLDMKQGESSRADTFSNIEFPVPSPVARVDDVLGSLGDVTHMPEPMIVPTDGESALGDDSDAGTLDVRGLPREVATERIEQRWREVRSRGGYRLRILVPDEDDGVSEASDHPSFFKFRLLDHMKRQGFDARFDTHTPGVVVVTALFAHH